MKIMKGEANMKKLLFIINPRAGKAQIKHHLLEILDLFVKDGYEVQTAITQGSLDAVDVVEKYGKDVSLILCSGGDGTLSETISGIMKLEKAPLLGYIPAGSTNDFASTLGISDKIITAANDVIQGEPYPIDVGLFCREKYFVYVAAFGIFTEVSYLTPQNKKNLLGHQAYMLEGVKSLKSLKSYTLEIESDELSTTGEFIFGMITNTISVGGFKGLVSQEVALNDGLFEVLLVRRPKTALELSSIISFLLLKEEQNDLVHKFKAKTLSISSKESVDWVLDGEFGGSKMEVLIENCSRKISIVRNCVNKC